MSADLLGAASGRGPSQPLGRASRGKLLAVETDDFPRRTQAKVVVASVQPKRVQ